MLQLDDPRWHELEHALGSAADTPGLLEDLASIKDSSARAKIWEKLWTTLCHQDDVFTASYAAVPHILHIAVETREPVDWGLFGLPAAIEIGRLRGTGPPIPDFLRPDYERALSDAGRLIGLHWHSSWDRILLRVAFGLAAAAKGDVDLADALMNLDDHYIAKIVSGDD